MNEAIQKRCRRICNGDSGQCFINNKRQLSCLSDMLINNVYGITSVLEFAMEEEHPGSVRENINEALTISRDLINWVKFLQITHDIRHLEPMLNVTTGPNTRSERRYPFPEHYEQYIELTLLADGREMPAKLVNFSRSGLQFRVPLEFTRRDLIEGILRTRHVIGKEVHFKATARYVLVSEDNYITGAKVLEVSDNRDFDFFRSVHEFIQDFIPTPPELRPIGNEGRSVHDTM
jgi:hypothetical protein